MISISLLLALLGPPVGTALPEAFLPKDRYGPVSSLQDCFRQLTSLPGSSLWPKSRRSHLQLAIRDPFPLDTHTSLWQILNTAQTQLTSKSSRGAAFVDDVRDCRIRLEHDLAAELDYLVSSAFLYSRGIRPCNSNEYGARQLTMSQRCLCLLNPP